MHRLSGKHAKRARTERLAIEPALHSRVSGTGASARMHARLLTLTPRRRPGQARQWMRDATHVAMDAGNGIRSRLAANPTALTPSEAL